MAQLRRFKLDKAGFENLFIEAPGEQHGFDAANAGVFEDDVVKEVRELWKNYHHQEELVDLLPTWKIPIAFDGLGEIKIAKQEDIKKPLYVMAPERHDIKISGSSLNIPTPQLVYSATDFLENWKQPFAGQSRVEVTLTQMRESLEQTRDIVGLNGKTGITAGSQSIGIVAGAYTTITSQGIWDVQTGSDGELTNPKAYLKLVQDYFADNGLTKPMVIATTNHVDTLLRTTRPKYEPSYGNNKKLLLESLPPGSRFLPPSNNLQCTVSSDTYTTTASAAAGTMLIALDMGNKVNQGIVVAESGFQQVAREVDTFGYTYAMRKLFVTSVIDQKKVVALTGIDSAT